MVNKKEFVHLSEVDMKAMVATQTEEREQELKETPFPPSSSFSSSLGSLYDNSNIPPTSSEQENAVGLVQRGVNLSVSAVAGGGKSTFLRHCCARSSEPVCILTYNKALRDELDQKIDAPHSVFTFHGLASKFFKNCKNDVELANIIDEKVEPTTPFNYKKLFFDEAQDMKQIFLDLILHIVTSNNMTMDEIQLVLVGDSIQMLYDYDIDDPAVLDIFQNPSKFFTVPFEKTRLSKSFRLTEHLASFANALLDPSIDKLLAGNTYASSNSKVDLLALTPFEWKYGVIPWIKANVPIGSDKKCMLLCGFKKGNAKLQQLSNMLTEYGYGVFVQGIDPPSNMAKNQIIVSSFHASKGGEADAVVVLDAHARSQHNPLHVAVTRSREKMLIVFSPDDVYERLARLVVAQTKAFGSLANSSENGACVRISDEDCMIVEKYVAELDNHNDNNRDNEQEEVYEDGGGEGEGNGDGGDKGGGGDKGAKEKSTEEVLVRESINSINPSKEIVKDLTSFVPLGREYRIAGKIVELYRGVEYAPSLAVEENAIVAMDREANVIDIYIRAAMLKTEFEMTRNIRVLESMKLPLKKRSLEDAFGSRISNGTREFDLLPSFALKLLKTFTQSKLLRMRVSDWVALGVLVEKWQGFHNSTHLLLPVDEWVDDDSFQSIYTTIRRNLSPSYRTFDRYAVLKRKKNLIYKSRYFAASNDSIIKVVHVDEIDYALLVNSAIPAALLDKQRFRILNAKTGEIVYYEFPKGGSEFLKSVGL